ncbi:MAG: Rrf2 family transcriptional regulator [Bacteroidales bacterium]|nr:Rrf2 family transcriptional regulator [Bacteroidales bacterium]MBN2818041.1 Rrf2 family transcriptional regulator [Bacteroidales bacterium]
MKLNTKTRYGVRTMIELAMDWGGKGLLQKEISESQGISYKYLDHIISALKARGLIVNVEGKKSGYRLTRNPEEITVYDIYKAFEPELLIVDCLVHDGKCTNERYCASNELWCELNTIIVKYLKSYRLKELADKQMQMNMDSAGSVYVI